MIWLVAAGALFSVEEWNPEKFGVKFKLPDVEGKDWTAVPKQDEHFRQFIYVKPDFTQGLYVLAFDEEKSLHSLDSLGRIFYGLIKLGEIKEWKIVDRDDFRSLEIIQTLLVDGKKAWTKIVIFNKNERSYTIQAAQVSDQPMDLELLDKILSWVEIQEAKKLPVVP